jgi:hypothetical protein
VKEGVEEAVKLWEQFVKKRKEARNSEEYNRELQWGWGDVEV